MMSQDVEFFKELLNHEIERLTKHYNKWELISTNSTIPDEVYGKILSVIGQTKLLLHDKLQQFRDLISACAEDDQKTKITSDDLQGFWDLVNLQIEDVTRKFTELEKLKTNNWESLEMIKPMLNTPTKHKRKNSYDKSQSEAAKLRLAAAKLEIQARMKNLSNCDFYF